MANTAPYLAQSEAPSDRACETIDARELPPPQPLRNTLELLAGLDESAVVVQLNDRRPQHLYPQLDDRGYQHETFEDGEIVVTVIWRA